MQDYSETRCPVGTSCPVENSVSIPKLNLLASLMSNSSKVEPNRYPYRPRQTAGRRVAMTTRSKTENDRLARWQHNNSKPRRYLTSLICLGPYSRFSNEQIYLHSIVPRPSTLARTTLSSLHGFRVVHLAAISEGYFDAINPSASAARLWRTNGVPVASVANLWLWLVARLIIVFSEWLPYSATQILPRFVLTIS